MGVARPVLGSDPRCALDDEVLTTASLSVLLLGTKPFDNSGKVASWFCMLVDASANIMLHYCLSVLVRDWALPCESTVQKRAGVCWAAWIPFTTLRVEHSVGGSDAGNLDKRR